VPPKPGKPLRIDGLGIHDLQAFEFKELEASKQEFLIPVEPLNELVVPYPRERLELPYEEPISLPYTPSQCL
jgi:hypothetical protein